MKTIKWLPVLLAVTAAGCDDLLDVVPLDQISDQTAIIDEQSARAALVGAYSGLQLGSYYGGDYLLWSEILTDNSEHTGTFASWADADQNDVTSDNGALEGMWDDIYDAINRANVLIREVPELADIEPASRDQILGEVYALRALHYHNLVRAWGGVPLVLVPPPTIEEASEVTRASADAVYDQILSDLQQAASLLSNSNSDREYVTPGFVDALRARVELYRENWAAAEAAAQEVVASGDYELVSDFRDMFDDEGTPTSEDIFRIIFTATDFNWLGYFYLFDGRFEQGATADIVAAFPAGDQRRGVTIGAIRSDGIEVTKFPTTLGGEDLHVIRYADVLLILAEAHARQNELTEAVAAYNQIRERAGVAPHTFGVDVATQDDVLAEIWLQRRLEFAFEGDRWFDLVRADRAPAVLPGVEPFETLWPIPLNELDVAPNLEQNPGY
ncbi:MAG: RagB/SusD family nutrient uptake outer membrane protein [Longimicrobiales bacterium]